MFVIHRKDSAVAATRIAMGIGVMILIALTVGCSGPASAPALTPSPVSRQPGPPKPPAPIATIALAKVKSISEAKPVDPNSIRGPRLAIDSDAVDFGDVPYQTAVAFSFNVKDVGTAPISLGPAFVRVKEGCWPPNVVVGATTLAPGQETFVRLAFAMHEGMGGPHLFEVVVPSNDPVEPEKVALIRANFPLP